MTAASCSRRLVAAVFVARVRDRRRVGRARVRARGARGHRARLGRDGAAVAEGHHADLQRAGRGVARCDPRVRLPREPVDVGTPEHPGGDAQEVSVVDVPELEDGTYVVTWRVISADAHPVRGAFTFTVGTTSTTAKEAQGLAQRLLTDEGGDTAVGVLFAISRFGAFAGLAVLIGAAAFLAYVWRDRSR